jgi:poly(A) polymerase
MRLRADAGEIDVALSDWWQEFSTASDELRQDMVDQVREEQQQRQRAPRVHKAPAPRDATSAIRDAAPASEVAQRHSDAMPDSGPTDSVDSADAPKKRRRRRRTSGPREGGEQASDTGI